MEKRKIFEEILFSNTHYEPIVTIICKALSNSCPGIYHRVNKILKDLIKNNKQEIKKECYLGLPDDLPSLRALIWKINLKLIPRDINKWENTLKKLRNEYSEIKNAFILKQNEEIKIFEEINENKISKDNVLSLLAENSDKKLLETIDKDINRTFLTYNFFSRPKRHNFIMSPEELNEMFQRKKSCIYQDNTSVYTKGRKKSEILLNETHSDVLERILYIYAKFNKDVGYVQGMNEILAPIYYCYCLDDTCDMENIEADAFWSFSFLMDDIKKSFQQKNDQLKGGIFDKLILFSLMISKIDKEIFNKLQKNSFHFAFKWINLFFSHQMKMPDLLRLWDIIFSEENRYYFVYLFSLAILKFHKNKILNRNLYETIEHLQNIQIENIDEIIRIAFDIKNNYGKDINEIIYYYDGFEKKGTKNNKNGKVHNKYKSEEKIRTCKGKYCFTANNFTNNNNLKNKNK